MGLQREHMLRPVDTDEYAASVEVMKFLARYTIDRLTAIEDRPPDIDIDALIQYVAELASGREHTTLSPSAALDLFRRLQMHSAGAIVFNPEAGGQA